MPHLSHQRCWVGPEYWQVNITKSHRNELENLAWGSRYADLTEAQTPIGIPKFICYNTDQPPKGGREGTFFTA